MSALGVICVVFPRPGRRGFVLVSTRPQKKRLNIPCSLATPMIYGDHEPPLDLTVRDQRIIVTKEGPGLHYRRVSTTDPDAIAFEMATSAGGTIMIHPVEPFRCPKDIAGHLLVELRSPYRIKPRSNGKIFLTFPIEIGVFIKTGKAIRLMDVFCFSKPKFTVYGNLRAGHLSRYHKSDILFKPSRPDPLELGIMAVTISNHTGEWIDVNRMLFGGYDMKIYFTSKTVTMNALMTIKTRALAITDVKAIPSQQGVCRSRDILNPKLIPERTTRSVMEGGF